ncbi:MAG: flagellar export chaperone FliS [Gammaproteobacteria bacterium]|nr:flagellar export chaperone FliS [Gammaproteobacteria bacterium]MDP2139329.1 flagellar export chaperone FliS [Gammaproteobacteria bacterium]MDP2346886.1 flagellar export chaperone FliS [Gammaproteobacteria bacterium]
MYATQSALAQYRKINTESGIDSASPHRLIQMLMSGALDRLAQAKGALERKDIPGKGLLLGKAISILAGLQASLDKSKSAEITANLDALYDYMQRRLLEANIKNDTTMIDEVSGLLRTVKSAWDEIDPSVPAGETALN